MPQTRLRILHLISGDLWAGAETQAYTLICRLAANADIRVFLLNDGILANRLREAKMSEKLHIEVEIAPENSLPSWRILLQLISSIRSFNPDIIHTHRQKENIFGGFANLLAAPFRFALSHSLRTSHGAPEFSPKGKQRVQAWLDRWVALFLQKKVIAVSQDLARQLQLIFPTKKIAIIRNGVDTQALEKIKANGLNQVAPKAYHIGIIGRLEPVKRVDLFLQIAAHLIQTNTTKKSFHFHILGDGKLRDSLEALSHTLKINENVTFHGFRSDVHESIKALDCVVMCSDHEGTPMVALECLALHVPLVAHAVGGLKDVLADYPTLLVDNQNIENFAQHILQALLLKPNSIALNSIYSADVNAEETLKLYYQLMD